MRSVGQPATASGPDSGRYPDGLRKWTPVDSVRLRYIVNPSSPGFPLTLYPEIVVAPDGRHFIVQTRQGDPTSDSNRNELLVFSTEEIDRAFATDGVAPPPRHRITLDSTAGSHVAGISEARWQDAATISFEGRRSDGDAGFYRFDLRTGKTEQRIQAPPGETVVRIVEQAGTTIALTQLWQATYSKVVTGPPRALRGTDLTVMVRDLSYDVTDHFLIQRPTGESFLAGSTTAPVNSFELPIELLNTFSLSPDGRWAAVPLLALDPDQPPATWQAYNGLDGPYNQLLKSQTKRLLRWIVVETTSGVKRMALDAPRGPAEYEPKSRASHYWSADSRHLVLVNHSVPLDSDLPDRRTMGYLIDYQVAKGEWSVLEPMAHDGRKIHEVGWLKEGEELLVRHVDERGAAVDGTLYAVVQGKWVGKAVPASFMLPTKPKLAPAPELTNGLKIEIRESANEPQQVVAIHEGRELVLLGEDPSLKSLWRAPVEAVTWPESEGVTAHGGLLRPRDSDPAHPLPLVVLCDYDPAKFNVDGTTSTAFAAQSLVARGMAVLLLDSGVCADHATRWEKAKQLGSIHDVDCELQLMAERLEAAVQSLAGRGIIDPQRVGLVGFSRTGYYAHYAISHPRSVKFAAVVVADSVSGGYHQNVMVPNMRTSFNDDAPGKDSFWRNKQMWLDQTPAFNADKIETPALFITNALPGSAPQYREMFETAAAFRANNKEFDWLLIPDSCHQLVRPRQRIVAMQTTVDWMDFWLQGREDTAPERAEQYRYWRRLRVHRDARWTKARNQPASGSVAPEASQAH